MNKHDMEEVHKHFEAALALSDDEREAYLARLGDNNSTIGKEVHALLDADARSPKWHDQTLFKPQLSRTMSIRAGDQIGPYRIVEQIGEGGMGVIFRALDERLERHVALKFLPAAMHTDDDIRQRFLAEARAACRLDHPNICVIHDVGETDQGQLYITMPCYEGETLARRIARGPLAVEEALDIATQVAAGLAAAHAQNIVHRDIKPSNIMLSQDGGIKVLDFGIAKVENLHLTSTGMSIGTLAYMSPEQLRGEPVDARTDIWALGVVLLEMLNGKPAFPGKALPDILQAVLNGNSNSLPLAENLPPPLLQVLETAMQRDLQQRYADMSALLEALQVARRSVGTGASDTDATRVIPASKQTAAGQASAYAWDEQLMNAIAGLLMPDLGPIAPTLVKRMARQAADIDHLRDLLAEHLPDVDSRNRFQDTVSRQVARFTTPPQPRGLKTDGSPLGVELSTTLLADMESVLVPHLGPIAQTMVRRYASNTASMDDLCEKLAQHIDNNEERQHCLQHLQQLLKKHKEA